MKRNKRRKSERGFVTTEFVLGVAFLVLPVALLVLTLPTWTERQSMGRVAAREASRTYVLTGDQAKASAVAYQIAANQNVDRNDINVTFTGDPRQPGATVQADVRVTIPAASIPLMSNATVGSFDIDETHSEIVDLYRSQPR